MAEVAQKQVEAPAEKLQALEKAFEHFSEQTSVLQEAYQDLKEEAEQINLELERTNRKLQRKVRQLDEANNFQRSILASIPTAVVVTDLEGVIQRFNPAAEEMWDTDASGALGSHFSEVMPENDELLEGVLGGRYRQESLRRELGKEEARIISSAACLVEDSGGRPIGAIQLDRDITRLCNLENQLFQHQKLADLGKMAAGLAHEVRKPLNGIKGFASLVERKAGEDAPQQKYSRRIMDAADRLNGMLGRLLDFASPSALETSSCDLRRETETIVEFVRAEDPELADHLSVHIPEKARMVSADPDKIQQVLLNLVKNALEALPDDGGDVRIEAVPVDQEDDRRVRVAVEDSGKGIPPEKLDRILEPFVSAREGGTGLGLAVVDRLLQLHGTELDISSEPGEGTRMEFELKPAKKEHKT